MILAICFPHYGKSLSVPVKQTHEPVMEHIQQISHFLINVANEDKILIYTQSSPAAFSRKLLTCLCLACTARCKMPWTNSLSREHHPCIGQSKVSNVSDNMIYLITHGILHHVLGNPHHVLGNMMFF